MSSRGLTARRLAVVVAAVAVEQVAVVAVLLLGGTVGEVDVRYTVPPPRRFEVPNAPSSIGGTASTLDTAVATCRPGGTICLLSVDKTCGSTKVAITGR